MGFSPDDLCGQYVEIEGDTTHVDTKGGLALSIYCPFISINNPITKDQDQMLYPNIPTFTFLSFFLQELGIWKK